MSARTVTVVTCRLRDCHASYVESSAWAAYEAWAAGWSKRFWRRAGRPYWFDLCPKHAANDEPET